jgi:hypothetical protein
MITQGFLNIFFWIVGGLVSKLPEVSPTSGFGISVTTASSYISSLYQFIPLIISTVLAILAVDILFESSYLIYKVINWIRKLLPTQS